MPARSIARYSASYTAILLVFFYFTYLVAPGLNEYFNPDDTTNLYKAWIKPPAALANDSIYFWQGQVRPMGQIAYRMMYKAFGWKSYPFRLSCLVLLETNLLLIVLLTRGLSKSETFRFIAPLIAAFHGALWAIYCNTGTIYDILCLTFTLIGLNYYLFRRNSSRPANGWDALVISIVTIAAFESKEIGFMLPAALLALELIIYSPLRWASIIELPLWTIVPSAVCSVIGAVGVRYSRNQIFFAMDGYTPAFTVHRYGETLDRYLHFLFFKTVSFSSTGAFLCVIAALAAAFLLKSRVVVFGWALFIITLIPLSFAPPRQDGYVLYVPYLGCAIFLGALFDGVIARIPSSALRQAATIASCALVIWAQVQQRATAPQTGFGPGGMIWIEQLSSYASSMCSAWPPGAEVAVIDNPFRDHWQPHFVFNLACNRRDIQVDTYQEPDKPNHAYTSIALYYQNRFWSVGAGQN